MKEWLDGIAAYQKGMPFAWHDAGRKLCEEIERLGQDIRVGMAAENWARVAAAEARATQAEAELAAARAVVEAARTLMINDWGSLDHKMLTKARARQGLYPVECDEAALMEALTALPPTPAATAGEKEV